ncbi:MAG: DUF1194 domain-containing protein [Gammaproteobacteria bacterium]|nr:DUF1194 domain-containing protein [Gammaproteobacteria bacterium]
MFNKFVASTLLCSAALAGMANATLVDLELQLLTDVSTSISDAPWGNEYGLQLQGYSAAFRNESIIDAILAGKEGSIAVQYIEWSDFNKQAVQLDWILIDSKESALAFADSLDALTRQYHGNTAIGSAINYGVSKFFNNGFTSNRQVIDISGDGEINDGAPISEARDAAFLAGIDTINGITIGDESGLSEFYINNVIGGSNAFHLHATDFSTFNAGIQQKLLREISTQVPEPTSIALFGLGLLGMSRLNRSKK